MRIAAVLRIRPLPLVLLLTTLTTSACGGEGRADSAEDDADAEAFYQAEGDEGLGASVAILIDNSGSMDDEPDGESRPKHEIARDAVRAMLSATESFVAENPELPINVGIYSFASRPQTILPIQRFDRARFDEALSSMRGPGGGTGIGDAMDYARQDLYRAGTFRKYLVVITDGENTEGRDPAKVAREIQRRGQGAVQMYFVAFDIDPDKFGFVEEVQGELYGAAAGAELEAALREIYETRILGESQDYGEPPAAADTTPATTEGAP